MSKILSFFGKTNSQCSLSDLLSPHINRLYRQAYKYCGSISDAEDLLQEVLLECKTREQQFRVAPVPAAWLSRVLYHRFVDHYRKQKRHSQLENIDDYRHEAASADSPAESVYFHKQLLAVMDELSAPQRMVISLHDMEGYTLSEISEISDIPIGTLKSHLHRGRKIIKKTIQLQPYEFAVR